MADQNNMQAPQARQTGLIIEKELSQELRRSYIEYAMSVIIGRSIPDVRDGLKPVQRRIIYSMKVNNFLYNRPYHKCATIVGHVLGHYHPHGDSSVYGALVRMAQDFSMRYPLIDGQGNFGSIDGDEAAAYRYTEARLAKISNEIIEDLDLNTVDFIDNFDGSEKEPAYMPSKLPNLLLNGATGIAVGMSTNIAPHNLKEVCEAIKFVIDNGLDTTRPEDLIGIIKGPDFPTGGIIIGMQGIRKAITTGKGRIVIRSRMEIVPNGAGKGKDAIIITEIPYNVRKSDLIEEIAEKVNKEVIPEIMDIRDESDRDGIRVVIELKQGSDANAVKNKLMAHTRLQYSFVINNLILVDNGRKPETLNYLQLIKEYINHREDVIKRRSEYLLKKAKERLIIVEGLLIAIDNIDEVIRIIKASPSPSDAIKALSTHKDFTLTETQAEEILKMRLSRLTGLQTQKLVEEKQTLLKQIIELQEILEKKERRYEIIKEDMDFLIQEYGDERRSEIQETELEQSTIDLRDTIPDEECVILLTEDQKIKRLTLNEYNPQRRGGKGKTAAKIKGDDFVKEMFVVGSKDTLLFFTSQGRVYSIPAYKIPLSSRYSQGKALVNFIELRPGEIVVDLTRIEEFDDKRYIIFVTKDGSIKKTNLSQFSNIRRNGIIGIKIKEGDRLICSKICSPGDHILIATKNGYAIHFTEDDLRPMGRNAMGVIGISLRKENDEVIDMVVVKEDMDILTITAKGYGKRTPLEQYRLTHRAGKGIINIKLKDPADYVVGCKAIDPSKDVIIASKKGIIIRFNSNDLRAIGRASQGVRVMKLDENDEISGVAVVDNEESIERAALNNPDNQCDESD